MAPQLCQFYVPGQPPTKTVRKKLGLAATKDTVQIKGKSQLVLFVSDSNTNRIRWNFSFYPDGGLVSTAPNTGTKGPAPSGRK